jgi:hypothetical protein
VGASAPASRDIGRGDKQAWGLQWCLREEVKRSRGDSASTEGELAVRPPVAGRWLCLHAEGGDGPALLYASDAGEGGAQVIHDSTSQYGRGIAACVGQGTAGRAATCRRPASNGIRRCAIRRVGKRRVAPTTGPLCVTHRD